MTWPLDRRQTALLLAALALATVALLVFSDLALADHKEGHTTTAGDPDEVGNNIKEILQQIAKPLLIGFVGLMALSGVIRGDFGRVMTIIGVGIAAGIPIFAPEALESFITQIAQIIMGTAGAGD